MVDAEDRERMLLTVQESPLSGARLRAEAMRLLATWPSYDWCGVYRLEGELLVLDEYTGAPTDHARIPIGHGVCGTAIVEDANQIVADVREIENYLPCSASTRSEIVVLIRGDGRVLGQIDIDGHEPAAFGEEDEAFLERLAKLLAARWHERD